MIDASALTDPEIDILLGRFDATEPALQRRIIARFSADRANLLEAAKKVLDGWDPGNGMVYAHDIDALRKAVALAIREGK